MEIKWTPEGFCHVVTFCLSVCHWLCGCEQVYACYDVCGGDVSAYVCIRCWMHLQACVFN